MEVRTVLVSRRPIERTGMQGTKALRSRTGDLISASLIFTQKRKQIMSTVQRTRGPPEKFAQQLTPSVSDALHVTAIGEPHVTGVDRLGAEACTLREQGHRPGVEEAHVSAVTSDVQIIPVHAHCARGPARGVAGT